MSSSRTEKDLDALNGRFIEAMEALGHSGYSLSKALGTSEAVISNIRKRKNPPNIQLVRDILNMHLELDPEWLLFGRGAMKRIPGHAAVKGPQAGVLENTLRSVAERMAGLEGLIERSLHNELERAVVTDGSLADLDKRLAALEKRASGSMKGRGKSR